MWFPCQELRKSFTFDSRFRGAFRSPERLPLGQELRRFEGCLLPLQEGRRLCGTRGSRGAGRGGTAWNEREASRGPRVGVDPC